MPSRQPTDFNLFDAEDRALAEAESLAGRLGALEPTLRDGVLALIEAYDRSVREQRRLVRLSDRQQAQLAKLNRELAKRTTQAEDALAKLRATQESLVQAEKLASLGALVGGVAHEINTPVGIALSCASHMTAATDRLAKLHADDDIGVEDFEDFLATARDTAALIQANCERAANLIGSFKQVAVDRTHADRRTFDLKTVLEATLVSLGPQIRGQGHQIDFDCPTGIVLDGYPGILSQIVSNFVMNSLVHAFGPDQHGVLSLAVRRDGDGKIRMVYQDNGQGIAAKNLPKVFDPFFTTRLGEGGSGLGLNIVYNLVTGPLAGTISAASPPGGGAVFTVVF